MAAKQLQIRHQSISKKKFTIIWMRIYLLNQIIRYTARMQNDLSSISDWIKLLFALVGGLAIFLFGMEKMSNAMKLAAGDKMRLFLAKLTHNRIIGLLAGTFVTMVIQSSSATTVMLVSFAQAELMTFAQTLSIILGADIGTTITAQLIAFKLTDYALITIALGYAVTIFGKTIGQRHIGHAVLGFGLLFFGMKIMGDSMVPLRNLPEFISLISKMENPLIGILGGAIFTAIIQSSSAFTGIVIVLAQQKLITLEAGIPLIMGANVGTCITAGLASIGANREAKRVALGHVIFKIAGILIFILWIPSLANLIRSIDSHFSAGTARQVANAHTIFNVGLALLFLPFVELFARLILRVMPKLTRPERIQPVINYLDDQLITTPALAIALTRKELLQMTKLLERMVNYLIIPFYDTNASDPKYTSLTITEGIQVREKKINFIEQKTAKYLVKISQQKLTDDQSKEVFGLMSIMSDMEGIGDIISKSIHLLAEKKQNLGCDFSPQGLEELKDFHTRICRQMERIRTALVDRDVETAAISLEKVGEYVDLEAQYRQLHLERMRGQNVNTIKTHNIHIELLDNLKHINFYTGNIAKTIAETFFNPDSDQDEDL